MHPVILTLGSISISSFGLFLALAFLLATFVGWRLAKIYDLNEEKLLDLAIITFLGGILGARIYFVALNWALFQDLNKVLLINRYPGLSFWGGLLGGMIALSFFARRVKMNFWQIMDFAAVGFMLGLSVGNIGCFLGGCGYGVVSNSPLATAVVGLVGKRVPISALESLFLLVIFFYLWKQVVRFHLNGKVVAVSLMILGVVKFFTEYFRGDSRLIPQVSNLYYGHLWAMAIFSLGLGIYYYRSKQNPVLQLRALYLLLTSSKRRELALSHIKKSWYNQKVNLKLTVGRVWRQIHSLPQVLRRRLNVKPTPHRYNQD